MATWTVWILGGVTVLLVAWDVYVASNSEPGDTISEVILKAARTVPALAFAFGFLCGHLFWPQR